MCKFQHYSLAIIKQPISLCPCHYSPQYNLHGWVLLKTNYLLMSLSLCQMMHTQNKNVVKDTFTKKKKNVKEKGICQLTGYNFSTCILFPNQRQYIKLKLKTEVLRRKERLHEIWIFLGLGTFKVIHQTYNGLEEKQSKTWKHALQDEPSCFHVFLPKDNAHHEWFSQQVQH